MSIQSFLLSLRDNENLSESDERERARTRLVQLSMQYDRSRGFGTRERIEQDMEELHAFVVGGWDGYYNRFVH